MKLCASVLAARRKMRQSAAIPMRGALLLLAASTCMAAEVEIYGTDDDSTRPKLAFKLDSGSEVGAISGSADGLNVSVHTYGTDFVTTSGTSLDAVGRRLDTLEQGASCNSLATEIAVLRADMATLIHHFGLNQPPAAPPPPLVPTQYTSCTEVEAGFNEPFSYGMPNAGNNYATPERCWSFIMQNRASGGACSTYTGSLFNLGQDGTCMCLTSAPTSHTEHGAYKVFSNCQVVAGTG